MLKIRVPTTIPITKITIGSKSDVNLRIAEREAMLAASHERRHRARLTTLGCDDDAGLCAAIGDGSLDHRFGEVVEAVRAATIDKLTVANPGHLALPG